MVTPENPTEPHNNFDDPLPPDQTIGGEDELSGLMRNLLNSELLVNEVSGMYAVAFSFRRLTEEHDHWRRMLFKMQNDENRLSDVGNIATATKPEPRSVVARNFSDHLAMVITPKRQEEGLRRREVLEKIVRERGENDLLPEQLEELAKVDLRFSPAISCIPLVTGSGDQPILGLSIGQTDLLAKVFDRFVDNVEPYHLSIILRDINGDIIYTNSRVKLSIRPSYIPKNIDQVLMSPGLAEHIRLELLNNTEITVDEIQGRIGEIEIIDIVSNPEEIDLDKPDDSELEGD